MDGSGKSASFPQSGKVFAPESAITNTWYHMSRGVPFEIPAENPDQDAGFYKKVLGWEIQKWEGPVDYWLISTGKETEPGIHGGIAKKRTGLHPEFL